MEEESMCDQRHLNRRLPPFLIGVNISILTISIMFMIMMIILIISTMFMMIILIISIMFMMTILIMSVISTVRSSIPRPHWGDHFDFDHFNHVHDDNSDHFDHVHDHFGYLHRKELCTSPHPETHTYFQY